MAFQIVFAWIMIRLIKLSASVGSVMFFMYAIPRYERWFYIYVYYKTQGVLPAFCTSIIACVNAGV